MSFVTPLAVPAAKPLRSTAVSLPLPLPRESAPGALPAGDGVCTRLDAGLVCAGETGWCGRVGYGKGSDVVEVAMVDKRRLDPDPAAGEETGPRGGESDELRG